MLRIFPNESCVETQEGVGESNLRPEGAGVGGLSS